MSRVFSLLRATFTHISVKNSSLLNLLLSFSAPFDVCTKLLLLPHVDRPLLFLIKE